MYRAPTNGNVTFDNSRANSRQQIRPFHNSKSDISSNLDLAAQTAMSKVQTNADLALSGKKIEALEPSSIARGKSRGMSRERKHDDSITFKDQAQLKESPSFTGEYTPKSPFQMAQGEVEAIEEAVVTEQ